MNGCSGMMETVYLELKVGTQQTFIGLEDVLKTCLEDVLKTCPEDVLKTYLEDVLKTLWRETKYLPGI